MTDGGDHVDFPASSPYALACGGTTLKAGKTAITQYWTIESYGQQAGASAGRPAAALIECRLHTGRTHQIRAHLTHLGAPLIGDPLYGKQRAFKADGPHADEAEATTETSTSQR